MEIKNVKLKSNIVLAPMAGVTDIGFRVISSEFGAGLVTTEMTSARAIRYGSAATVKLLETNEQESPKAAQLFGHDPIDFEYSCKCGVLDKFDIIDVNMGCPAPKIIKNGDGSALLKQPKLVAGIVESLVKNTSKPVSVKIRKSYSDGAEGLEIAKICEECGASMITVHGRTRPQMYSGQADLEFIAKVKASLKIPVFGNGDVVDLESFNKMLSTGVDGVAIGRGALGRPYIFSTLNNKNLDVDKLQIILKHIDILKNYYSDQYINKYMRKHFLWYLKDEPNARRLREQIVAQNTLDECLDILTTYFRGD